MKRFWYVLLILAFFLASCGSAATETNTGGASSGGAEVTAPTKAADSSGGNAASGGDVVITADSAKKSFDIKVGQKVTVKLQDDYDWNLITTPDIILAPASGAPADGVTGTFEGKMMGKATLQATGTAKCAKDNPPCDKGKIQFDVSFTVAQ